MILLQALKELNLDLTPQQIQQLLDYVDLLKKWNKVYNLTSITADNEIIIKHLIDCLAVLPQLYKINSSNELKILDVGSGAGLPSIIWAIMHPNWQIYSIDCVQKKIAFQQQVKISLNLKNLFPLHSRIENLQNIKFNIITARAYANTNDIISQTQRFLDNDGCYFLLKGKEKESIDFPCIKQEIIIDVPYLKAQRYIQYIRLEERII